MREIRYVKLNQSPGSFIVKYLIKTLLNISYLVQCLNKCSFLNKFLDIRPKDFLIDDINVDASDYIYRDLDMDL